MKRATFRQEAEDDVYSAARHIAEDAGDLEPAYRFIDTISAKTALIATHPEMGRERPELASGLRSFPVGAFIIFYRPSKDGIEVIRVVRGSRDIPTLF